jgi:transketolase
MTRNIDYWKIGREIRRDIIEAFAAGGRGHIGPAMSIVEILTVLFETTLRHDPRNPKDPDRDRVILSKGHGCLALYAWLARRGYFPKEELKRFCKPEGILGGHPDHHKVPGVEASTGALGHGLSVGLGMAVANRLDRRSNRIFVILGDGECNEGSVWEAAMAAGKHGLDSLVALVDYNKMQSYGRTKDVLDLEPFAAKWSAFGFETRESDLNQPVELEKLMGSLPFKAGRPSAVICHTIKGKGIAIAEGNPSWHHKSRATPEEIQALLDELDRWNPGEGKA